jgi:hypothetical protein
MHAFLKIRNFDYIIALAGYFLIGFFILNKILFSPGTVGFFHDWFIGPYPETNSVYADGGFYIWDSQKGNKIYPTDWIFRISLIPFSFLGGEAVSKGLLIFVVTLSGFGAYCLGRRLGLSQYSSFAAGVLYVFSPVLFTRIIAGYIYYLIAYFLSPLIVSSFLKGNEEQKKNKKYRQYIIAGILTSVAVIQLQFLVMIFIVLLVFALIDLRTVKRSAIGLIIVFSITFLINLSPIVLSQTLAQSISSPAFNPTQLLAYHEVGTASNLTKSLRLLGYEVHPYSYTKIGTPEDPLFESEIENVVNKINLVSNPSFTPIGDGINNSQAKLPRNWNDPIENCQISFRCTVNPSTGWKDNTSLQLSTNTTKEDTWSWIYGNEINVKPDEQYELITHMKLNQYAAQSHIVVEGYNETSKSWDQIIQCPDGTNGPLEWQEYRCLIAIPKHTTEIRPVLNAGWSSQFGREAITLFDTIDISKLSSTSVIVPLWVFYLDFLLPIVGFSVLIFRRDKYAVSFAIICLIGLFLMKGLDHPLASVFRFIYIHGLLIFREIWHIAFLYGFGVSFLIAFFLEKLIERTRRITSFSSSKPINYSAICQPQYRHDPFYMSLSSALSSFLFYNRLRKYYKFVLSSFLVSLIVISNGYPLLIGNFGGYLQTFNFPQDYHTLYKHYLTNSTYDTLILPLYSPITYDGLKIEGIDPLLLNSPNNIFDQLGYNLAYDPLTGISSWLHSVMQANKTNNFGKLLSAFGIKYIIFRKDFVSNMPHYVDLGSYAPFYQSWYSSLEPFLDTQKDLQLVQNTSHYKVYENTNDARKLFVPLTVANGLYNFSDLLYISNFTSLSNVAVYPYEKNTPLYDFIGLGQYAPAFDATQGWANNRDWFGFDYLLASRVNVGAFTTTTATNYNGSTLSFGLTLPSKYENKPIEIWMKALTWPKGNLVSININGKESTYNLYSVQDAFSLIKIYDGRKYTDPNYRFLIRNIAGQNYIEGIYIKEKGIERASHDNNVKNKISMVGINDQINLVSNPNFSLANGSRPGLPPLYWNDPLNNCEQLFKCSIDSTTGWEDNSNNNNTSFQLSTASVKKNTWSEIHGNEINVKPDEQYELITHMKLNQYATDSHVSVAGYNETSNTWYQLNQLNAQCPSGNVRPLEWQEFVCLTTIPKDTTKIRPVLNAGWSSQLGREAVTLFDTINVSKSNLEHGVQNIGQIEKQVGLSTTNKLNPTLWSVHISNATRPFTLGFAESYDPVWEARIYKDGKKVDVVKASPLYGAINGFQINQTGNLDIELRYTRQDWFERGIFISAISFAFCLLYIFYEWRRSKGDKWIEKVRMKKVWQMTR